MLTMTIGRAAAVCGGTLLGCEDPEIGIGRAEIDSRKVSPGDLFVAYRGERTDGHRYIASALQKGAVCALAEELPAGVTGPVILVDHVQTALERICTAYRMSLDLPVIGISGSVGKTTAKEMIASVLSQHMRVLKTEGNLNNQIGVPMTVSRIEREHEAAVIEMGISGFGEMTALAAITRPTIAVFTVIGRAHLEFLQDLDGVFRAKTEMLAFLPKDGIVICNGDDPMLRKINCSQRLLRYGMDPGCDLLADEVELLPEGRTRCRIRFQDRVILADIPAFGRQLVYAALAGAAVGIALGLSDDEIEAGISAYATVGRRNSVTDTGFVTLVDDSYNANPESMRCAIDSLAERSGRHVCIFGDMLELGEDAAQLHFELGRYAAGKGMDLLLCCGALGEKIAEGAGDHALAFPNAEALIAQLPELLKENDVVLVKASLGMHLERVSEAVRKLGCT